MTETAKDIVKNVPDASDSPEDRRAWMTVAASANGVGEIVRYGATKATPMTVEVLGTDDVLRVVRFEVERDAEKHGTLRAELIRQGRVRAEHITNAKVAGDFYYVMATLARVIGPVGELDVVREWCDGYRLDADRVRHSFEKGYLYGTLAALRAWPYSKRHINVWMARMERRNPSDEPLPPPRPPLFIDPKGGEWTSITHLATYIRWGRDEFGVIHPKTLAGNIAELGGRSWVAHAWDDTTRRRQHKISTTLIRFPDPDNDPSGDEGADDV